MIFFKPQEWQIETAFVEKAVAKLRLGPISTVFADLSPVFLLIFFSINPSASNWDKIFISFCSKGLSDSIL